MSFHLCIHSVLHTVVGGWDLTLDKTDMVLLTSVSYGYMEGHFSKKKKKVDI